MLVLKTWAKAMIGKKYCAMARGFININGKKKEKISFTARQDSLIFGRSDIYN